MFNAQFSCRGMGLFMKESDSPGLSWSMIRFETGTVFRDGQSGMEHMASFNYAYQLTAVRDRLFEQGK